jgi:hypothetical protein
MILATSFKGKTEAEKVMPNPSTFDNPVYALTGGVGIPTSKHKDMTSSHPDADVEKEDLAMIGSPLYESDIEL